MIAQRPITASRIPGRRCLHANRAFTLVEMGMVVLIIGVVAALSVPQIKKYVVTARSETVINDLRVFSQSFERYLQDNGDWPKDSSVPGQFPTGMKGYLRESSWTRQSPIGGYYVWQTNIQEGGQRVRAAITITSTSDSAVSSDRIQLVDIDRRLDDGNLATGTFRLGFNNEPVYVIEY